jgi:hypothetical protein
LISPSCPTDQQGFFWENFILPFFHRKISGFDVIQWFLNEKKMTQIRQVSKLLKEKKLTDFYNRLWQVAKIIERCLMF